MKGSQFERDFCRTLSEWWTGSRKKDVVFWRTSQSGGRATARTRGGKRAAAAHCGDIAAITPSARPLTRLITFELKRGYNHVSPLHLIDRPRGAKQQPFGVWLLQADAAARLAKTPFWMIVHKRDKREPMAYFPEELLQRIAQFTGFHGSDGLYISTRVKDGKEIVKFEVVGVRLPRLFHHTTPDIFRQIWSEERDSRRHEK